MHCDLDKLKVAPTAIYKSQVPALGDPGSDLPHLNKPFTHPLGSSPNVTKSGRLTRYLLAGSSYPSYERKWKYTDPQDINSLPVTGCLHQATFFKGTDFLLCTLERGSLENQHSRLLLGRTSSASSI